MIDDFAISVATQLNGLTGSALESKAHAILDSGDFQGNVPELKEGVTVLVADGKEDQAVLLMWRAASNGLEAKNRYGR